MPLSGFFDRMRDGYDRTLQMVMRHRGATMFVSLVIFIATVILFVVIPKGFFPRRRHRADPGHHRGGAGHFL